MKSVLRYLKDYKKESILAPLFKMLEASFELIVPLVMASIIDVGIKNSDRVHIVKMSAVLVLLGAVGLCAAITAQYFAAKAATGFSAKLRHALFEHIQDFSFSQIDLFGTDTLINRMTSDINDVQGGVNMFLRLFMRSPFVVFGAMIMAFTVDVKAAFIFVVTIPLLSIVVFFILLWTIPLYKDVQNKLDKVMTSTRENLTGVRVIRAFNREESEKNLFKDRNQTLDRAQQYVGAISGVMNPLTYLMINVATVILIYTGAVRIDIGILTQGQVIALLNYMSQILIELIKLANLIIQITKAIACGNRIATVLETRTDMVDGTQKINVENSELAVEFDNVSLLYEKDGEAVLENMSFSVKKGQTVGIIGGTGSGKTSLISLIPRFYDATSGQVRLFGQDVKQYSIEDLRSHIGIVLQKAELFKGTIADNLKWGDENASIDEINKALDISQAREFVEQKNGKTDFMIEQNGRNLSGGQKQRLTIARALMKKPDILILDDSASALDFATDAKLRMAIAENAGNMTTFIVSQRAASVQNADLILVLDEGKIAGMGTHDKLLEDNEVYQEIYYSQFPKEDVM
ncbi:ABC-type multidrug transport system, ATPase and permease component [Butyrivibrio fibrisolvens DSM 3071]|uniref:ABC-type multidrug transport system, ATPase and permease component n=1 Tax=Butyrivibrio fibrisolvens DSM 3071 TaxID=1121131 RepID=A0A1M6G6D9_BUTFI|nr:ABC transporter ATP-binding protein [Butyrivibrio fibrisolvens]SHJ05460.1 ABC-type multidrug transport system, ATPase and permease component [Butyrivibrio fibrisolvens DSM 3071]